MLSYAVEKEFIDFSVAKDLKAFKENNQRTRYLSKKEYS